MPPLRLYDIVGADDRRFSPYCWRIKLALAHKGLAFETVATPFGAIATIADGQQTTVPVLDDGGRLIRDSFAIAEYLEASYPDRPSLFGGPGGHAAARFVESWSNSLHPTMSRMVVLDIHDHLLESDKPYFRQSREQRLRQPLEQVVADRDSKLAAFRDQLMPLRLMLKTQPFIGGATPNYADYIVFGSLQWPRVISAFALVDAADAVRPWFDRCLDLFDGLARKAIAAGA